MRTIGTSLLVCLWLSAPAGGADDLFEVVRTGHRQAREGIRVVSLKFETRLGGGEALAKAVAASGKYSISTSARFEWVQEGERVRWSYQTLSDTEPIQHLYRDGRETHYRTQPVGGRPFTAGVIKAQSYGKLLENPEINPWLHALFLSPVAPLRPMTQYLDEVAGRANVTRVNEDGRPIYRLKTSQGDLDITVDFDPGRNFLVSRTVVVYPDNKGRDERRVVRFREVKPGLHFPEVCEHKVTMSGGWVVTKTIRYDDIRLNDPIDPSAFDELRFPVGTLVADYIEDKVYRVDGEGRPTTAKEPLLRPYDEQAAVDAAKPRWYTRPAVIAAAAVALVCASVLGYRLVRRRTATS